MDRKKSRHLPSGAKARVIYDLNGKAEAVSNPKSISLNGTAKTLAYRKSMGTAGTVPDPGSIRPIDSRCLVLA